MGIDKEIVDIDAALKRTGLKRLPKNLKLIAHDAIEAMKKIKPGSRSIVFGSYVLNCISHYSEKRGAESPAILFLELAKKAVKPGGRIIIVEDKAATRFYKAAASHVGLGFHAIEISDKKALHSKAWAIRKRASPKRRISRINKYFEQGTNLETVLYAMESGTIESPEEFAKPTIFIMQKPRQGEHPKIITPDSTRYGLASLTPEEQKAVAEIMRR
ncbi:MAG: hypothetical protein PHH08_04395 [Candidatus ainarchaeum sp.]|nr:hypothetical protein [Candidatus ainarchaeum sp.]